MKENLGGVTMTTTMVVEDDQLGFQYEADTTPLLDDNARLAAHQQYGSKVMGAKLVARTPAVLAFAVWPQEFHRLTGKRHTEDPEGYRKFRLTKLDSPEYSRLRVDRGKLGGKTDVGRPQVSLSRSISSALRDRSALAG